VKAGFLQVSDKLFRQSFWSIPVSQEIHFYFSFHRFDQGRGYLFARSSPRKYIWMWMVFFADPIICYDQIRLPPVPVPPCSKTWAVAGFFFVEPLNLPLIASYPPEHCIYRFLIPFGKTALCTTKRLSALVSKKWKANFSFDRPILSPGQT
jgi:hypothetical protein